MRGGSNIVTLPSFGSDGDQGAGGGRSSSTDRHGSGITVVATSRSGGAFNFYGALKGDKVYTIYIETGLGTAVMQFADPTSAAHAYAGDLTAPEPMRAEVPSDLQRSRLVIVYSRSLRIVEKCAGTRTRRQRDDRQSPGFVAQLEIPSCVAGRSAGRSECNSGI